MCSAMSLVYCDCNILCSNYLNMSYIGEANIFVKNPLPFRDFICSKAKVIMYDRDI